MMLDLGRGASVLHAWQKMVEEPSFYATVDGFALWPHLKVTTVDVRLHLVAYFLSYMPHDT